jgi:hypothetical protein
MELMQRQAKELIALQPDIIITSSSPITGALLRLTQTIPIVFTNIVDPVGQGFVTSLSRPGGNATGLVNLEPSMAGKWIELLKEVMPRLARVVIPYNPASSPYADLYLNYFKSAAPRLGVTVITASVADLNEFETIASREAREPYRICSIAQRLHERPCRRDWSANGATSASSRLCDARFCYKGGSAPARRPFGSFDIWRCSGRHLRWREIPSGRMELFSLRLPWPLRTRQRSTHRTEPIAARCGHSGGKSKVWSVRLLNNPRCPNA